MCCGVCVGSCLYQSLTSTCGCRATGRTGSLLPYFALMLFTVVIAIILRYSLSDQLSHLYYQPLDACDTARCIGYGAVFRISFATFAFFLTHAILLLFPACWSVDRFSWVMKIFYWVSLIILSYVLPEGFYADFYVHVSRVVAGFFLFLQIVILIDMAHSINESWKEHLTDSDPKANLYKAAIIGVSLVCLILSGVFLVLYYRWFGGSGCQLNQFFISFTLCVTVILIILSITEKFSSGGGLLPASIVTVYCYWICYSGLSSDPTSCNSIGSQQETAHLIVGLTIAAASIAYAGYSVGTHKDLFGHEAESAAKSLEEKAASEIELGVIDGDRDSAHARAMQVEQAEGNEEMKLVARRNLKFHAIMAACAMYMAMLLTNWGSTAQANDIDSQGNLTGQAYDQSVENVWIKFVSQWLTMILYGWSLVAPVVCSNRDFS